MLVFHHLDRTYVQHQKLIEFIEKKMIKLDQYFDRIIDAEVINNIDSTGATALNALKEKYSALDIEIFITNVKGPVRDALAKSGITEKIGIDNFFMNIQEAVDYFYNLEKEERKYRKYVNQSNTD